MSTETPAPRANGEPAVVDGELRHLSVSQLKDFVLCERSWWFSRVMRLARKATKGQATGTEGHAQLEHYLKTGEDVLGPVAAAGKHLLPEPGEGLLVELALDAPPLTAAGVPFKGFIDLLNLRHAGEGLVRVTDHKFTSDIDRWAARPSDLATTRHEHGIQMVGYARWVSARWPWVERLELEHLYYQTKGAKRAESRVVTVEAGEFRDEWKRVENTANHMKDVAKARELDDVHPNWSACDKYGGCSYRTQCLSNQATKGVPVSLLNRLKAPAPVAPAAPPAVLPPDAPASDPAKASVTPPPVQGELTATQKPLARKKPAPKAPEPELPAEPAPVAVEKPAPAPALRVFVDCLPNGPHGNLAGYLSGLKSKLEAEYAVADIRCAPSDSPLAFAKWRGVLAAAVRASPPAPGTYVVVGSRSSELVQVLVEALEPLCAAGDYVRGVQ